MKHQASERDEGQPLDCFGQPLVVAGQAPKPGEPAKTALHYPPPRRLRALLLRYSLFPDPPDVAYTQLRLARACVADQRLPWERRLRPDRLTPYGVRRAFSAFLFGLGTPASPPKPYGRSPGRPKGHRSEPARRYPALKKTA